MTSRDDQHTAPSHHEQMARITCPVCGNSSAHPDDIANGYCGHCHAFTSAGEEGLLRSDAGSPAALVSAALGPKLDALALPIYVPGDTVPEHAREVLFEGISLKRGSSVFYTDTGEPIDLPPGEAMVQIRLIREGDGREVGDHVTTAAGVPVLVSTGYLGVDMSLGGPVPLIWETMVFVGDGLPHIAGQWRYGSRAAAHAGHAQVVGVVREAAGIL